MTDFNDIAKNIKDVYYGDDKNYIFYPCKDVFTDYKFIPSGSIDCIITDPPYPKEYLHYWKQLAEMANIILKPSGFLITYVPQYYFGKIVSDMTSVEGMNWYAQIIMTHDKHRSTLFPRKEICGYKPIHIYQKSPVTKPYKSFLDIIQGSGREKDKHIWQQSEDELFKLINTFTLPNDIIFEPFGGSGTTAAAALRYNRRVIITERDVSMINVIDDRIKNILRGN